MKWKTKWLSNSLLIWIFSDKILKTKAISKNGFSKTKIWKTKNFAIFKRKKNQKIDFTI